MQNPDSFSALAHKKYLHKRSYVNIINNLVIFNYIIIIFQICQYKIQTILQSVTGWLSGDWIIIKSLMEQTFTAKHIELFLGLQIVD